MCMPVDYTILPSDSATLCYSLGAGGAKGRLRGINSVASVVGASASLETLMVLIEFHPGALWPLICVPQSELRDASFPFADIAPAPALDRLIASAISDAGDVAELVKNLDAVFLPRLTGCDLHKPLSHAMKRVLDSTGTLDVRIICRDTFLSERQMERLFKERLGMGMKAFSRIVRLNGAVRVLETNNAPLSQVAFDTGYSDQPHFAREFKALCGVTPAQYRANIPAFYNDTFKL